MESVAGVFVIAADSARGPEPEPAVEADPALICSAYCQLHPPDLSRFKRRQSVFHQPCPDAHFLARRIDSNRYNFRLRLVHARHHVTHDLPQSHGNKEQAATITVKFAEHRFGIRAFGERRTLERKNVLQVAGAKRADLNSSFRRHGPIVLERLAIPGPAALAEYFLSSHRLCYCKNQ